ncbi:MgtC/SapB family protein [bacterium]|nr:MgtC/SapB family protein [bacterium]
MIQGVEPILQLLLAAVLGGILGLEREYGKKEAGLRTYMLVATGSALFTIIAREFVLGFSKVPGISLDPLRAIQAIAIGIGFIGSGLIIFRRDHIEGLTTAAGLWLVAAIGVAVGFKLYILASFATLVGVLTLTGLYLIEKIIFRTKK